MTQPLHPHPLPPPPPAPSPAPPCPPPGPASTICKPFSPRRPTRGTALTPRTPPTTCRSTTARPCAHSCTAMTASAPRRWPHGPGMLVLKGALPDHALVDAVTQRFQAIIESERHGQSGGDHFAKAGANDRVW